MLFKYNQYLFLMFALLLVTSNTFAHHVLGRPAYSLGDDSNTPPSMQLETKIGKYYVTYMAFPAFPKPGDSGRINMYVSRVDNGASFNGKVTFKVRDDSFFSSQQEVLGVQSIDDGVYRQAYLFKNTGDYIITAEFESAGIPYTIDFPLRIGDPFPIGAIGFSIFVIGLLLFVVNFTQRKRLVRLKASQHHASQHHSEKITE